MTMLKFVCFQIELQAFLGIRMPSAGAVCPPQITPLRKHLPGIVKSQIDTTTLIELNTGKSSLK